MPHFFLLEPVDEVGSDWRYRLVGTEITRRFETTRQAKGKTLKERFPQPVYERGAAIYREVTQGLMPVILRGKILGIDRDFYDVETVHLPILGADDMTRQMLGAMFFFN